MMMDTVIYAYFLQSENYDTMYIMEISYQWLRYSVFLSFSTGFMTLITIYRISGGHIRGIEEFGFLGCDAE
jgi:hypothetical protein